MELDDQLSDELGKVLGLEWKEKDLILRDVFARNNQASKTTDMKSLKKIAKNDENGRVRWTATKRIESLTT